MSSGNGNGNGHIVTHVSDDDWATWERARGERAASDRAQTAPADRATLPARDLAEGLTEKLGVDALGLKVLDVEVFGRGRNARVDIHLTGGARPLRFESFGDVAKPAALAAELMAQLGVIRSFKVPEALGIGAMLFQLARHHDEADEDEFAREWGSEYLRVAPTEEFDASDQGDRWRAFSALARLNPARSAGSDSSAHGLAASSLVLVDAVTRQRYVRAGWFQAFVRREAGGVYSPAALATLMQRVGWHRPGAEGRVKATAPNDHRALIWAFFVVMSEWDIGPVTAGDSSNARACARARNTSTPAVTRSPDDQAAEAS